MTAVRALFPPPPIEAFVISSSAEIRMRIRDYCAYENAVFIIIPPHLTTTTTTTTGYRWPARNQLLQPALGSGSCQTLFASAATGRLSDYRIRFGPAHGGQEARL